MRLDKPLILFGLLAATTMAPLHAKKILTAEQTLDEAYLSHWFSYDSAEPIRLSQNALENDEIGERAEIQFTSDDGQPVNGLVAFPKDRGSSHKVALAMHPMGSSQQFWWSTQNPLAAHHITSHLRQQGYTVISLDARKHGKRGTENFGPRELLKRAHSSEPRIYIDTIIGSVRDYRIVLNWAKNQFNPDQIIAMGYSMGAQMSLLLASVEPTVSAVIAMVPPYVNSPTSPVAPRVHVNKIVNAKVLWLAGRNDPHSKQTQTQSAFSQLTTDDKSLIWFDSGHRLPAEFLTPVLSFFDALQTESEK